MTTTGTPEDTTVITRSELKRAINALSIDRDVNDNDWRIADRIIGYVKENREPVTETPAGTMSRAASIARRQGGVDEAVANWLRLAAAGYVVHGEDAAGHYAYALDVARAYMGAATLEKDPAGHVDAERTQAAEIARLRAELAEAKASLTELAPARDETAQAIRADERARIRSLLPYNVNCCDGFPAAVADLINENQDSPTGETA